MRTSHRETDELETLPPKDAPVRGQPEPGMGGRQPEGGSTRPAAPPAARLSATFTRIIDLHPARLDGLHTWWALRATRGRVRVARRLSLEEPRPDAGGTVRIAGHLRSPWLRRTIPVELSVWPWLTEWTKVSLEPQRHVVITRSYFRRGHRALDVLAARLAEELHFA